MLVRALTRLCTVPRVSTKTPFSFISLAVQVIITVHYDDRRSAIMLYTQVALSLITVDAAVWIPIKDNENFVGRYFSN